MSNDLNRTVHPAIKLFGFDEEVCNAIEQVSGSTLVVDGMKAENSICDATKTLTITLEICLPHQSTLLSEMANYLFNNSKIERCNARANCLSLALMQIMLMIQPEF